MSRRRLQQRGDLYEQSGLWKLRWREDQLLADGTSKYAWSKPVCIGPSTGPARLTEKQARRVAWDNFLSRLDQNNRTPQSLMTVAEFVARKFIPEHVNVALKPAGRKHYQSMLPHVLRGIGHMRLRDVTLDDVQRLVTDLKVLERKPGKRDQAGKLIPTPPKYVPASTQTMKHVRNAVSAIFSHAERKGWWSGTNPAKYVQLPEMQRKEKHALTFDQAKNLLAALPDPYRTMVLCAMLTSMNVAELCGLQWKRVNLTDTFGSVDGESLPPLTILVRQQWYRGAYGSVKAKSRRRNIPIPKPLIEALCTLHARKQFVGPDDPVFASRTGVPIDEHNVAKRWLKKIGAQLGMPWLSWHDFRRTHATLADQTEMSMADRMAMLGHSDPRMTMLYTADDLSRRREVLDKMAGLITETVQ